MYNNLHLVQNGKKIRAEDVVIDKIDQIMPIFRLRGLYNKFDFHRIIHFDIKLYLCSVTTMDNTCI